MEAGKLLTVVVPACNAEAYLRNNLESFLAEEILDQIEVLVIDDGSSDRTGEIAEAYAGKYPQSFRVVHKENGGHGSGINCGISRASGIYFKVVDADDWVEKKAFVRLVRCLKEQAEKERPADIVSSGFLWAIEKKSCRFHSPLHLLRGQMGPRETPDTAGFRLRAETRTPFRGVKYNRQYRFDRVADRLYIKMHNMTIRTEILRDHDIRIDEHCYYVDSEYITYPIPWVETVCFADASVYRYRIGRAGQSVSIGKMRQNEENYDRVIDSLLRFYGRLGPDIPCSREKQAYIAGIIARVAAGRVKALLSCPPSGEKKRKLEETDRELREHFPEIYRKNRNKAVAVLRRSGYRAYLPACALVRLKYRE